MNHNASRSAVRVGHRAMLRSLRVEQQKLSIALQHHPVSTLWVITLAAVSSVCATPSFAQPYPTKPIRLVVPFAPGGGTDVTARYVGTRLSEKLGQPVVIDNRPAASGVVGADLVAKAAPDGHTLLVASVTFVISSALQKGLPYDGIRDFAPITELIAAPLGLLVHPSLPVKS